MKTCKQITLLPHHKGALIMVALKILGHGGEILGSLVLPASIRLVDLEALKQLGVCRLVKG